MVPKSTHAIAIRYWANRDISSYLCSVLDGQPSISERPLQSKASKTQRRLKVKQLSIAVSLVVAFAAPALAEAFPNPYLTVQSR
jgi:hypothetical protein